jgi:hypothetical protein
MRLLHRSDDVRTDEEHQRQIDTDEPEHGHRRHGFRNPFAREARDDDIAVERDRAADGRRAAAPDPVASRDTRAERERARERDAATRPELREEVVEKRKRWDAPAFLTAAYGAALAVVGALALARTGIDESWYRPVTHVADVRHSPLLGAIEVGVGALIVLALLLGLRTIAALVTLAAGVAATVVAIEPSRVNPELAIERGWAVALAAVSLVLGLLLVATRDRRRERRVVHRPVTA